MSIIRALIRDLRIGLIRQWYKYLYIIIMSLLILNYYISVCKEVYEEALETAGFTVMDAWLVIIKGDPQGTFNIKNGYVIPVLWMCIQIGIHYIIAYYAEDDLRKNGRQLYLATKSKNVIWISKCIWCAISVALYYLLIIAAIMLEVLLGKVKLSLKIDLSSKYFISSIIEYLSQSDIIYVSIVIIAITIALCLVQQVLSIMFSSIVSFAVICMLYVASGYYMTIWLPGNYTMFVRNAYLTDNGMLPSSGLVLSIMLSVISIVVGMIYLNSKDVLE